MRSSFSWIFAVEWIARNQKHHLLTMAHTQLEYHITRLHLRWFAHDVMVGVTLKHVPTVTNGSANGLIGLLNVDTDTTIGFGEVYTMLEQN